MNEQIKQKFLINLYGEHLLASLSALLFGMFIVMVKYQGWSNMPFYSKLAACGCVISFSMNSMNICKRLNWLEEKL